MNGRIESRKNPGVREVMIMIFLLYSNLKELADNGSVRK